MPSAAHQICQESVECHKLIYERPSLFRMIYCVTEWKCRCIFVVTLEDSVSGDIWGDLKTIYSVIQVKLLSH